MTDQQPAHMLGCAGNEDLRTPHIDLLARRGTRYVNAVSGFPLCCPFRGSLLSSRYPHQAVPGHQKQLPPELPTVADAFREHGYRTAWFGKWHVDGYQEGDEPERRAARHVIPKERRGRFDDWLGYENNNRVWDTWVHGHVHGEEVALHHKPGYEVDLFSDLLLDHLAWQREHHPDQPWFAAMSVQPPHDPYHAPAEDTAPYAPASISLRPNVPPIPEIERRARAGLSGAYGQVASMDRNVGRILRSLEEAGELDQTIVCYFSDHGDLHGSHGLWEKHLPYTESIGIPFIACDFRRVDWYPVDRHEARVPINHVDILPTSLGLAGLPVPDWCQGRDCSGPTLNPRGYDASSVSGSAYLQNLSGAHPAPAWRGIATEEGIVYVCSPDGPWHCYDHRNDPYELHNLAEDKRQLPLLRTLHAELLEWIERSGDDFSIRRAP